MCVCRISFNKLCPLINALAGMYLILINAALLIYFNRRRGFYYELGLLISFIKCTALVQPTINLTGLSSRI